MFQIKVLGENQNTHFLCPVMLFTENLTAYKIKSKNAVEPKQTVRRMRFLCWINKATREKAHTRAQHPYPHPHAYARARIHSPKRSRTHVHTRTQKYVIFIAFPLQQWLRERALMLHASLFLTVNCVTFLKACFII